MRTTIAFILLVAVLVSFTTAIPSQLSFKKGQEIIYKLHGTVDARGNVQTQGTTDGTFSTMDSTMVIKCVDMDSNSFMFAMNMFDTRVSVGQEAYHVANGTAANSASLGYDMYFQQSNTGEIQKIWYDRRDDQYFVNVKISAINTLQTKITPPGQTQTVLESDPVGVHYSVLTGIAPSNDDVLVVDKAFSQKDFEKFSDPDVTGKNVVLMARATTGIDNSGFIRSSQTEQYATVDNMARSNAAFTQRRVQGVNTNSTGFDMNMQSHGVLNIDYQGHSIVLPTSVSKYFSKAAQDKVELYTSDLLVAAESMYHIGVDGVVHAKNQIPEVADAKNTLKQVMNVGDVKSNLKTIQKLVRYFKNNNKASQLLEPYFVKLQQKADANLREKLFLLAVGLNTKDTNQQMVKYALKGNNRETKYHALLAITSGIQQPSAHLMSAVSKMANEESDAEIRDAAFMAYGSLLSFTTGQQTTKGRQFLIDSLNKAIEENKAVEIVSALGAISNAGSNVVPVTALPASLFSHAEIKVRSAAMFVLQSHAKKYNSVDAKKLISLLTAKDDPDYPYNKDYNVNYTVGGKTVSAQFDAQLFVGTNFDCNHPTFNYKGLAEATGSVALFGVSQQVFDARALYAKKGSQLVGDELFLSVFDKVLFQKSIGRLVDCSEHTYDLFHAAPGFSVSYTVWVSIVPVTFRASASLVVDAKWGWNVCDDQLSALVELIPTAELVVAGDAEIDLLIIRGAIELNGKFSASIIPQAYVHGTQCAVGFDVKLVTQPMTATLEAYYMTKKCKYLFFDCKWGPHNNKVIWQWQLPSKSDILYQKEWTIQV